MNSPAAAHNPNRAQRLQQVFKWVVYSLLLINWGFYIHEDWTRAVHTLTDASGFLDWTAEFATSIDESAWFILLAMFELETYVLEDEQWKGWVALTVHGIRILCYIMIAHTVIAFAGTVVEYRPTIPVEGATSLCDLTDRDFSYVFNLEYTEITPENCHELSGADRFFQLGDDPVVTDAEGLELERDLALADAIEVVIWLVILLAIELIVRLQERNITGGTLMFMTNLTKRILYGVLIGIGIYWAWLGHWLYFWDELVWIGGFAAIEMNVSDWRLEIIEGK